VEALTLNLLFKLSFFSPVNDEAWVKIMNYSHRSFSWQFLTLCMIFFALNAPGIAFKKYWPNSYILENQKVRYFSRFRTKGRINAHPIPLGPKLDNTADYENHTPYPPRKFPPSKLENAFTLVLNADYTPISYLPLSVWKWKDSLHAVITGKARVVSEYSDIIVRSVSQVFKVPSVIVLNHYYRSPTKGPAINRRFVFLRDDYRCQYCLKIYGIEDLTLDHVLPRARGGKLTWTNTVTACDKCNYKKGHIHPDELHKVGMRLRQPPYIPTYQELAYKYRAIKGVDYHPDWNIFLKTEKY
jgi:5-methylcytosine-specific restriction endonuclease McrA